MLASVLIISVLLLLLFLFAQTETKEKIALVQYFEMAVAYQLNSPYYVYQIYIFYSANFGIKLKLSQYRLFFICRLC